MMQNIPAGPLRGAILVFVAIASSILPPEGTATAQSVAGIELPPGFKIEKFAGDELATNIFCLTVDPQGSPVVSGPGYIRVLRDEDDDGRADRAIDFSSSPRSGAQGLCPIPPGLAHQPLQESNRSTPAMNRAAGMDLLYVGDDGLWRLADRDGDGRADGPPRRILAVKTGGEHDAHSIQRGPDGYWYLICGNQVPARPEFHSADASPIQQPHAGFLMRLSPDFSQREIIAHGFRNAYDFAFNRQGELFVYDSDGERDIALPWYRPTRVFRITPGDHAGWVSVGWKRPSDFFDMPDTVGALGRGSPTGVVAYLGRGFPAEYDNALFVADWTFGRVVVFRWNPETGQYDAGKDFIRTRGHTGFAVTDLAVGPPGELWLSVGGRGTEGGVYRVTWKEKAVRPEHSRSAALDPWMDEGLAFRKERVTRAIRRIAARHRQGAKIDSASWQELIGVPELPPDGPDGAAFMEALIDVLNEDAAAQAKWLYRLLPSLSADQLNRLARLDLPPVSRCLVEVIRADRLQLARADALLACLQPLPEMNSSDRLIAIRLAQLALGGCDSNRGDPVFHGYQAVHPSALALATDPPAGQSVDRSLLAAWNLSNERQRQELARLAAMLELDSRPLAEQIAAEIAADSDPVADIHWLICLSRMGSSFDAGLQQAVAHGLVNLADKMEREQVATDRNWLPRMRSLAERLLKRPGIAGWTVRHIDFGKSQHGYLYQALPAEWKQAAVERFVENVMKSGERVTPAQLRIAGQQLTRPEVRERIRQLAERPDLQATAVQLLARRPMAGDRQLLFRGLAASNAETVRQSAIGLRQLGIEASPDELLSAFYKSLQLGWDRKDVSVRDQLIRFLQQQTGWQYGYEFRSADRQDAVLRRWQQALAEHYPEAFQKWIGKRQPGDLGDRLAQIDWASGRVERGRKAFQELQCAQCHEGGSRLGPPLAGITQRFGRADLFRSIVAPDLQVADRYRAVLIETVDGQIYRGAVIYESVDGITLMESSGETVRVNREQIEARADSTRSLMPAGLLDRADDQTWADLMAYLQTL